MSAAAAVHAVCTRCVSADPLTRFWARVCCSGSAHYSVTLLQCLAMVRPLCGASQCTLLFGAGVVLLQHIALITLYMQAQ